MKKNIFIYIFVFYILLMLTIRKYYFSNKFFSNNFNRHKHSDVTYAHFSWIDKVNYFLYPKLLLTSPQKYTLKAGDALVIPKIGGIGLKHMINHILLIFGLIIKFLMSQREHIIITILILKN